jgi:hypothetical protein
MSEQIKVTPKRPPSLIFKVAVSMASAGLVIVLGLVIVAFNFSEAAATSFIASMVATPTQTPAQKLAQLQQVVNRAGAADDRTAMIEGLVKMRALAPNDAQITTQLAQLYYEQGLAWRDANRLEQARQSFDWALSVEPDLAIARQERQLAELYLTYEFIISTGEPGRDTAIGEFEIQSKIPMAYASTWNLDMPYWLGIYWAGPLENGFHAVPTVRDTGVTMWDGYPGAAGFLRLHHLEPGRCRNAVQLGRYGYAGIDKAVA